ncbi:MAG: acyl carrier protein [Clostridia bacterium]|nr:acyl carrier protein [Clostridia bacterium]
MESKIFEKLVKILSAQFKAEEEDITMETNIIEDLGADSLDIVDIIMAIEDEFKVEVPDTEVENIKTVGDVVNYIENMK